MTAAASVVAMGGYNTFCEILSFDKRALIVPRTAPRLEQFIRTQRAAELGLLTMLPEQEGRDPRVMATALRHLTEQPPPSAVDIPGLLDGMLTVNRLARQWLDKGRAGCFAAREFPLRLSRRPCSRRPVESAVAIRYPLSFTPFTKVVKR